MPRVALESPYRRFLVAVGDKFYGIMNEAAIQQLDPSKQHQILTEIDDEYEVGMKTGQITFVGAYSRGDVQQMEGRLRRGQDRA